MATYCRKTMMMLLSCCLVCLVALAVGTGTAHAALTCESCHSMPPLDAGVRSPSTGGVQGNHQTHATVSAQPTDCSKCHDVTGFTSNHRDGVISLLPNINGSPITGEYKVGGTAVTSKNQTSLPTLGSCSNVNCHFERTTPDWGSPSLGARSDAVCSTCHDSVPTTNAHSTHTAYYVEKNGGVAADTCNNCHVTNYTDATHASQFGRPINVTLVSGKYSTAMKTSYLPSQQAARIAGDCSNVSCHSNGSGVFAKPNWGIPATGACGTCHGNPPAGANETSPYLPHSATAFGTYVNTCANCHVYTGVTGATHINSTIDKQAFLVSGAHKNGSILAGYSAAYITSKSICADCHNTTAGNLTIRQEWAATGHANTDSPAFAGSDFKTNTSTSKCNRCHTTTGFVRFSSARASGAWGVATDYSKEVVTCRACHSDEAVGTVRVMTPVKPFSSYTAFQNANMGSSNLCANCHSGRDAANRRIAAMTNFSTALSYGSHYLPAAGTVQGITGYAFPGRSYTLADNGHGKVGTLNANNTGNDGPCVTCHMTATDKHSFEPVTAATDGTITAIKTNICTNCHSTGLPVATLDAKRLSFNNAMDVLKAAFADKGIVWNSATKTFNTTAGGTIIKWGAGQAGKNRYGAATNYRLFYAEPAAYSHNPEYVRQLIVDSIDAVYNNGTVTGDITAALADLLGRGKITLAQNDSLVAYKNPESSCTSCHGNPPNTETHSGIAAGTCASCHTFTGMNGATHRNGTVDLNLEGASCNSCHGYPPAPRVTESQLTFGVQGQWSSARFEDYSGGGGAHTFAGHLLKTVKPSDGWTPCLTCHSGGASQHSMTLPVRNHVENLTVTVQTKWQFSDATLPVYTSAKLSSGGANKSGTCFNISCHFKPTSTWSLER